MGDIPETIRIPIAWYGALIRINQIAEEINDYTGLGEEYIRKDLHNGIVSTAALTAYSTAQREREEILKPIRDVMERYRNCFHIHPTHMKDDFHKATKETLELADK